MFSRVVFGGVELPDDVASVMLDIMQDFRVPNIDDMHGPGRKVQEISAARNEAWARLSAIGLSNGKIARMFGVTGQAVARGRERANERGGEDACPCCGRPYGDRFAL